VQFFKIRRERKELKEVLHYAKHVRHMHEDITAAEQIGQLRDLEKTGRSVRREGDPEKMEIAGETLVRLCETIVPPRRHAKLRENVEVLFVAIAAAMAIRAFFFQPFKIPTGSMQPTLYGITIRDEPVIRSDNPVARIANMVLFGERVKTVRAKSSGYLRMKTNLAGLSGIDLQSDQSGTHYTIYIGNVPHRIPAKLLLENRDRIMSLIDQPIRKGDVLLNDVVKSGDYILVNRFIYNFIRPKRGDIAVFDTRELTHPQVRKDAYYIKRMVGLPGETLSVAPPYLLVNGEKPSNPRFHKIFNAPNYNGYQFAQPSNPRPLISAPGDSIQLAGDEYLFFGDNTNESLDARYFGAVHRRQILGPAFFVCWPFDRAGFAEISH
jgi:signal peptidase I